MKAVHLRSARTSLLVVVGAVAAELQIGQLRKKIVVFVVPELSTNIMLGTAFIEKYVAGTSPKTRLITPSTFASSQLLISLDVITQ